MQQQSLWLGVAALLVLIVCIVRAHEVLAISHPVEANILIVEGWIWYSAALEEASEEFKQGKYEWLVTVGPTADGDEAIPHQTVADFAARELRDFGVDANSIVVLPVPTVKRHRTYTSALIVKDWLMKSAIKPIGVNVFTRGVHARRSLILFERALGPQIAVGVIAGTEDTYDTSRWWLTRKGFLETMREIVGCFYVVWAPLPDNLPGSQDLSHENVQTFYQVDAS